MSFVTTEIEALAFAAGQLQSIGSSMAVENAATAAPTTGVVPAAADEVSVLQAAQFAAYGNLYQQVSAQATAIYETFVRTLGISADSYGATEAANSAAAGSSGSGFSLIGQLTQFGQFGLIPGALNNGSLIGILQVNMFGAAASDMLSLITLGGSSTGGGEALVAGGLGSGSLGGAVLAGEVASTGPVGARGVPVLAGMGQASSVGGLSATPSWVGEAGPEVSPVPATLAGAGWTAAASGQASVATVPAGIPSVATAGKSGGLGAPRYGVKPTVMPGPTVA